MSDAVVRDVPTAAGTARTHRYDPASAPDKGALGTLVLGHGAGGGVAAPDLVAITAAAVTRGWTVVLVEQPWRVAGRRVATPPATLDVGWSAVMADLAQQGEIARPLVVGGRSAGARVACRTAQQTGADGVCALAFPLHPPGRPEKSRAGELLAVGVPTVVVQGRRDPFGSPEEVEAALAAHDLSDAPGHIVVEPVDGDHALRRDLDAVVAAVLGHVTSWERA